MSLFPKRPPQQAKTEPVRGGDLARHEERKRTDREYPSRCGDSEEKASPEPTKLPMDSGLISPVLTSVRNPNCGLYFDGRGFPGTKTLP